MGKLLFRKARDRKHRRLGSEVCWLSAKGTEPAILLMHKALCHSLFSPFYQRRGSHAAPRMGPPLGTLALLFLRHSVPTPHPSSSGFILHPDSSEDTSMSCIEAPPCCWILGPHNVMKDESVCREKTLSFSWSGLIYQRYFSICTQLFSERENRIFFPRAIGPAKVFAIVNLTKHRTFLPK